MTTQKRKAVSNLGCMLRGTVRWKSQHNTFTHSIGYSKSLPPLVMVIIPVILHKNMFLQFSFSLVGSHSSHFSREPWTTSSMSLTILMIWLNKSLTTLTCGLRRLKSQTSLSSSIQTYMMTSEPTFRQHSSMTLT